MARFLSAAWIDDLRATASAHAAAITAGVSEGDGLRTEQVVTGSPEGPVVYHLIVGAGRIDVGPGPIDRPDIRFVQDVETAIAISAGRLNAQTAFIAGRLKVSGDMQRLLAAQSVLAALAPVWSEVRARPEYPAPSDLAAHA